MTPKQQRFVEEYLVDLNATQAAIRSGYSPRTAKAIGHENLTKPDVSTAIAEAQFQRSMRTEITADWVVKELVSTYQEARTLKHLPAANQSLQLLARHLGMFTDRIEVTDIRARAIELAAEHGIDAEELERTTLKLLAPPK